MNATQTAKHIAFLAAEYWRLVEGMTQGGKAGANCGFFAYLALKEWRLITRKANSLPPKE